MSEMYELTAPLPAEGPADLGELDVTVEYLFVKYSAYVTLQPLPYGVTLAQTKLAHSATLRHLDGQPYQLVLPPRMSHDWHSLLASNEPLGQALEELQKQIARHCVLTYKGPVQRVAFTESEDYYRLMLMLMEHLADLGNTRFYSGDQVQEWIRYWQHAVRVDRDDDAAEANRRALKLLVAEFPPARHAFVDAPA